MKELDFEYLRDVLENITYWETCPETYRQRFKTLIKQIDNHREELKNNVTLGSVSKSFTEKQMDDAYDKGYEDGATAENEMH